jgi:formylglycine-generating enzyme required for sulfatase activity
MRRMKCAWGNRQKRGLIPILVLCIGLTACQQIVDRVVGKAPIENETLIEGEATILGSQTTPTSIKQSQAQNAPLSKTTHSKSEPTSVAFFTQTQTSLLEVFQDCEACPKMVRLPAGSFRMGSPVSEAGRHADESQLIQVDVPSFAMALTELTRFDWMLFERQSGYRAASGCLTWDGDGYIQAAHLGWRYPGFSHSNEHPAVCVSWQDAQAYARWLSSKTGHHYRLPSEREWEYAARAGTSTPYPWSGSAVCRHANIADEALLLKHPNWKIEKCNDGHSFTAPVGSYAPNAFGLYDMHGNVMEWVQDCWSPLLLSRAGEQGPLNCRSRVIRGGSWDLTASYMRSAYRGKAAEANRGSGTGFRLVRTLP